MAYTLMNDAMRIPRALAPTRAHFINEARNIQKIITHSWVTGTPRPAFLSMEESKRVKEFAEMVEQMASLGHDTDTTEQDRIDSMNALSADAPTLGIDVQPGV